MVIAALIYKAPMTSYAAYYSGYSEICTNDFTVEEIKKTEGETYLQTGGDILYILTEGIIKPNNITSCDFLYSDVAPQGDEEIFNIALENNEPVIVWLDEDGKTIWMHSNATEIYANPDCKYLLYQCEIAHSVEALSHINTAYVEDLFSAFAGTKNVDWSFLENWDVSSVKNFENAFTYSDISDLTVFSNWNTSEALTFKAMFAYCTEITTLDGLENWNTAKVLSLDTMFRNCSNIADISAIANWNVGSVIELQQTFLNVTAIEDASCLNKWIDYGIEKAHVFETFWATGAQMNHYQTMIIPGSGEDPILPYWYMVPIEFYDGNTLLATYYTTPHEKKSYVDEYENEHFESLNLWTLYTYAYDYVVAQGKLFICFNSKKDGSGESIIFDDNTPLWLENPEHKYYIIWGNSYNLEAEEILEDAKMEENSIIPNKPSLPDASPTDAPHPSSPNLDEEPETDTTISDSTSRPPVKEEEVTEEIKEDTIKEEESDSKEDTTPDLSDETPATDESLEERPSEEKPVTKPTEEEKPDEDETVEEDDNIKPGDDNISEEEPSENESDKETDIPKEEDDESSSTDEDRETEVIDGKEEKSETALEDGEEDKVEEAVESGEEENGTESSGKDIEKESE